MKRALGILLAALLTSTPLATLASDWSGAVADQMISYDDNEYARGVQLVFDEWTWALHAFWAEDAPSIREVHYGRSLDGGSTWTSSAADRVISLPDGNAVYEEPAVVLVSIPSPTLLAVWSEDHVSTREVHYGVSNDEGLTFTSETQDQILSDPSTEVDTGIPSIAVDSGLTFHVVWQQVVNGVAEVHYSRSSDGGQTWSGTAGDRIISFPDGNGAITPKIVVGAQDRLIVAWRETGDGGSPSIHVGISDDGGDTWSSEIADREISQPVNLMTNLAATAIPFWVGPDENIHVVYTASFDDSSPYHYEVYATSSADNGDTWTGESVTTMISHDEDHTRSAHNPDVYASGCAGVIAAWDEEEDAAGTNEQHISIYDGFSWSGASQDEIISFPDGENGYRPSITGIQVVVVPPRGGRDTAYDMWVAWTEFAGGTTDNYEVHLSGAQLCVLDAVPAADAAEQLQIRAVPNPSRSALELRITCSLGSGWAEVEVFDVSGRSLRRMTTMLDVSGSARIPWDQTDSRGDRVVGGRYWIRLKSPAGTETIPVALY